MAVSAFIALGTSKGIIQVFDYNQDLKAIIGPGTKGRSFSICLIECESVIIGLAIECGAVTSISISADLLIITGGHASGNIFTWELAKPAKPFLQIPPVDRKRTPDTDGHLPGAAILHLGFLGTRHTALVSADDKGMAFSHLATRGMSIVGRTVRSTRILGRYPDPVASATQTRKPSSVLAFSPLPLGNAEHSADSMGLVAMLTPYLLVIVSTTPIAQTQFKFPRPKELAHTAMSAALAWFPSVKLKAANVESTAASRPKLVYCWSNILTIVEVIEIEPSDLAEKGAHPTLQFRPRSRWKAEEAIVAVQWLGRSVLSILTITQQLIILEDNSLRMTDASDLIQKHIYHTDLFSQNLSWLVENLDEEDTSMHGVVADAFYMSFRAYKGRLFLLGHSEVSFGTLSNWADRLLALVEEGHYIGAIELATSYYNGKSEKVTVGLPEDDMSRHAMVQEKLLEMIIASLRYAFSANQYTKPRQSEQAQIEELAAACINACTSMNNLDFLFETIYESYTNAGAKGTFLETLEPHVLQDEVDNMPPTAVKDLVDHYKELDLTARLEEMICHLDPRMIDIDQITSLCKTNGLWDALFYVWNQALGDYTTILDDLLNLAVQLNGATPLSPTRASQITSASKVFPYLSYILTGRIYPTGKDMFEDQAFAAKAEVYHFFFSGSTDGRAQIVQSPNHVSPVSFPNLRKILDFDAPSFLSMMNEAFEDPFLNGQHPQAAEGLIQKLTEEQTFGSQVNRQWVISILLEVMTPPNYEPDDIVYLHIFIARNLPKYTQFILLPGHVLHCVLEGLCQYPDDDLAEECQLSVEYLLSIYHPPDLPSLVPLVHTARFYRVLKSVYRVDKQYSKLLETCFEDESNPDAIFDCIGECLRHSTGLNESQRSEVLDVILSHASNLVTVDPGKAAATIQKYAPDLHGELLQAFGEDDYGQLQYLRTLLEPENEDTVDPQLSSQRNRGFVEQYVRLLCDHDPHHVSDYVEHLHSGDLRLEEVLPALESGGVVDAAVVLMARDGKIREGLDRLVQHLRNLEGALSGLFDGARENPDALNMAEATKDLIDSIRKYVRIGIWLCRGLTKSDQQGKTQPKLAKPRIDGKDELSANETLWVDLIDAVVGLTKNIDEVLQSQKPRRGTHEKPRKPHDQDPPGIDTDKVLTQLRSAVQETFTALLATTSAPRTKDVRRTDASFLRILRAFLSRASMSTSSLTNLRSVLSSIFSAYAHEESLLALANRLLDKDLFVHITEVDRLRRRGWRPLGQVCEGCGRRVWGPGAGMYIWDAWQRDNKDRLAASHSLTSSTTDGNTTEIGGNAKGKAVIAKQGKILATQHGDAGLGDRAETSMQPGSGDLEGSGKDDVGPLVIFACRHMFHRTCLRKMQGTEEEVERGKARQGSGTHQTAELHCPMCADDEMP